MLRSVVMVGRIPNRARLIPPTDNVSIEGQIATNKAKIAAFKAGYGSIAFFEDQATIEGWIKNMPFLEQGFKVWSENSSGMLQCVHERHCLQGFIHRRLTDA